MTRKDYISIAKAIKAERVRIILQPRSTVAQRTAQLLTLDNVVTYLVVELHAGNPRFDQMKFRQACGQTEVQIVTRNSV